MVGRNGGLGGEPEAEGQGDGGIKVSWTQKGEGVWRGSWLMV